MSEDRQMRIKANTLKLVRMFAGELQMKSGQSVSDDGAIYELFKRYRPDIIDRLKEIEDEETDKN